MRDTTLHDLPLYRDQAKHFLDNTDWEAWEQERPQTP